jgi:hypothetical protein
MMSNWNGHFTAAIIYPTASVEESGQSQNAGK